MNYYCANCEYADQCYTLNYQDSVEMCYGCRSCNTCERQGYCLAGHPLRCKNGYRLEESYSKKHGNKD